MSFKDQVAKDIGGVFINPAEFAEEHSIDGVNVQCVLDSDAFLEQTGLDASMDYDGVFFTDKILYIAASFFNRRPIEGQEMRINNDYYIVQKVAGDMGMLNIHVRQNAS